ncbi:MAG: biotin/lipoate A/B protein ligase family protein, partial [Gemmatimonadota bacterium]
HDDELTYAAVFPASRATAAGGARRLCARVHEAIARGLEELGVEGLELAREAPRRLLAAAAGYGGGGGPPAAERAASGSGRGPARRTRVSPAGACFAQTSPSELAWRGRKLVGSAQRRLAGALLQHGSLLLDGQRPELRELWLDAPLPGEAATLRQAAGRAVDAREAACALRAGFEAVFDVALEPGSLTPAEQERAGLLARERYGREEFLYRL